MALLCNAYVLLIISQIYVEIISQDLICYGIDGIYCYLVHAAYASLGRTEIMPINAGGRSWEPSYEEKNSKWYNKNTFIMTAVN